MPSETLLQYLENHITPRRKELFLKIVSERTRHFTVALENIYQPHNASAVVRSCECFGIQDLHVIEKENLFKPNEGIVMGANKWIDLKFYKNSIECLSNLKKLGYKIIATMPKPENNSMEGVPSFSLDDYDFSLKTVFFFGEESIGLSKEVIENADGFLHIPMVGFTESFNISVTVALVLHHLTLKLRNSKNINWKMSEEEMIEKRIDWAVKSISSGKELLKYYKGKIPI